MGRAFEYRRASKEKRWDKMSKLFPKLAKSITMAAREGGSDPDSNGKLRVAIAAAKAQNLPKDNIDKAIKRASGKDAAEIKEINYEGKGPHGSLIFVECATDNTNRSVTNVKMYFNKNGGEIVNGGSLEFLFDRKAVVEFEKTEGLDLEEVELGLIDHGLEELDTEGEYAMAYGEFAQYGNLTNGCEELGLTIVRAGVKRIPNAPIELTEEQMEEVENLIDIIEDDEDVQAVYTNIA